jgi:hypothetical protein
MQQSCIQSVYTATSFPRRSWHTLARDTYATEITIPIFRLALCVASGVAYPDALRRVIYFDAITDKRLVFLTNNFTLPALSIAQIYTTIVIL